MYTNRLYVLRRAMKQENRTKEQFRFQLKRITFDVIFVTDTAVIIENQLECFNHDHLGKSITYASGLSANVIIWIVKETRAEHRSPLNGSTTIPIKKQGHL